MYDYRDLPSYAVDYLNYLLSIRGLSVKTVDQYYLDLRIFFRYFQLKTMSDWREWLSLPDFDERFDTIDASQYPFDFFKGLTLSDLYDYLNFAVRGRDNDTKARARKISSIRGLYKYLDKNAMIDDNPSRHLEVPKNPRRLPVYMTVDESLRLLKAIDGPNRIRDRAIIMMFLSTGIRRAELCGIDLKHITDDHIRIIGKGNKERILYLNPACRAVLEPYLEKRKTVTVRASDGEALFISREGRRISTSMIDKMLDRYLLKAGLDVSRYSPHKLRHTAATLMFQNGVDIRLIQEILGHENLATTQIYTHLDLSQLDSAMSANPIDPTKEEK